MPGDLVTNLIVLHPCTKFEVRTPSHSGDIADFLVTALIGLVTLIFDLLTSKMGHESACHGLHSCHF